MGIYETILKKVEKKRNREIGKRDFFKNLDYNTIEIFKSKEEIKECFKDVINELAFTELEEKLLLMLSTKSKTLAFITKPHNKSILYKFLVPGYSIDFEIDLYTKLIVLDAIGLINEITSNTINIDSNFILNSIYLYASDELKSNKEFAKLAITINGKYFSAFNNNVREDEELATIALHNDKDAIPNSFLNSSIEFKANVDNALAYIELLRNNYSAAVIYDNILKYREKNNTLYPHDNIFIGKNSEQIQKYWLSDRSFISGLVRIDNKYKNEEVENTFASYIAQNKIIRYGSELEDISKVKVKK